MSHKVAGIRLLGTLALVFALTALIVACGSDPTPAPTATSAPAPTTAPTDAPAPTPEPTEAPTSTPEPAPTPTTPPAPAATTAPTATPEAMPEKMPEPSMTLADLQLTQATVGKDIFDLLSEAEVACVKSVTGEDLYQVILATPILVAASDVNSAAFLFNCLAFENVVHLGVAFLSAQAGGWADESRACISNVGLGHPEAIFIRLGLNTGGAPADPAETLGHNVLIYECLNNDEKKAFTLSLWIGLDRITPATGADIFALLSEEEAACVREGLSEEQYSTMVAAQPLQAVSIGAQVGRCIDPETNIKIFASGIEWAIGGATEETLSCLESFARENPAYVALLSTGIEGITAMPADQFLAITAAGNDQYACMTEEELLRVQQSATAAMQSH